MSDENITAHKPAESAAVDAASSVVLVLNSLVSLPLFFKRKLLTPLSVHS